jgi:hypothetical protein
MRNTGIFALGLCYALALVPLHAAQLSGEAQKVASSSTALEAPTATVSVTRACVLDLANGRDPDKKCYTKAALKNVIRINVENLDKLLKEANDKDVVLFLNSKELKGIRARNPDVSKGTLEFKLWNNVEHKEVLEDAQQRADWASIFGFGDQWRLTSLVKVSVGIEGQAEKRSKATLTIVRMRGRGWVFFFVISVMGLLYWWAANKGAFSDRGLLNSAPGAKHATSLARVQMGWWFFLVVAAFFYIWITMGYLPNIPASVLGLIGIASGTALGASVIDSNKREKRTGETLQGLDEIASLKKQKKGLEDALTTLTSAYHTKTDKQKHADELNNKQNQINELDKQIQIKEKAVALNSEQQYAMTSTGSWFRDMLSDANGVSFHRLQMVIWTVVLGIVFFDEVAASLSIPVFDESLLALMGISAGTYLGFKLPEQQPAQQKTGSKEPSSATPQ